MKMRNERFLRALTVGLAAILLLASLPCQALAATFSAKVTAKSMPVYVKSGNAVRKAAIPQNETVTVGQVRNGMALIRYRGHYCLARTKDMAAVQSDAPQSAPAGATGTKAVTKVNTLAFSKPDTGSASVKIRAGTAVTVLAVKKNVAQVERNGVVAYMYRPHLLLEGESMDDSSGDSGSSGGSGNSLVDAFSSGKYSNEQLCFLFLTKVMGYNTAAAAGVLGNINYESGFKTTCVGDGGTSYGICQWHASRKTRLINYCASHNLDPDSLLGQLVFLKYELETYYPKVHQYMKSVSNTADGAYDAAYYFCYNFEAPAARTSQSVKRGSSAQKTYFPRYASL